MALPAACQQIYIPIATMLSRATSRHRFMSFFLLPPRMRAILLSRARYVAQRLATRAQKARRRENGVARQIAMAITRY